MSKRIAITLVALLCCAAVAWGDLTDPCSYYAYKDVPDVDKPDRDGIPGWPDPGDMSCWQACAANLLGGAGYGTAATKQANATLIYNEMVNHFGFANAGNIGMAVNWWLYNHGLNPADPNYGTSDYTDVTVMNGELDSLAYDSLLDELKRCQYVAVSWEFIDYESNGFNHCLTLVGGTRSVAGNSVSVWHDSDTDNGGSAGPTGDDDVYNNTFGPPTGGQSWHINYPGTMQSYSQGYTMLCPGLKKPESAVLNYDAAYYWDRPDGNSTARVWRVIGDNAAWGEPQWDDANDRILYVPNEPVENMHKEIFLLVDYEGQGYDESSAPDIQVRVDNPDNPGQEDWLYFDPNELEVSADGGQILYTWVLDHQPAFEEIIFPSSDYQYLTGDVKDFNLATECIPEPTTLALLATGVALLRRKRRRR